MLFYQREMNGECEYVVNGIVVWGDSCICNRNNVLLHK